MKHYFKKIISVLSCTLVSTLFIFILFFFAPKLPNIKETFGEITEIIYADGNILKNIYTIGKDITAVRISDLEKTGKITKVNYVANKFVKPGTLDGDIEIVDLSKPFEFAEKGTLIFIIANLDSWADNFDEQVESLSQYKTGDYWRFTIQLPKIFSASNIYQKANLVARHGEIENYDFTEYNTNYDKKTESFSSKTDLTYIDLQFYTKREALGNAFSSAEIITVHYQSTGSAYSGISNCPVIGEEETVKRVNVNSKNILITFAIISTVVFASLAVLSFVEKSMKFISSIVWIFGITVMLFSRFFLCGPTSVPLLWSSISLAMSFIILGSAQFALGKNFGKIPTKYIFLALSALGVLFAFLCPFVPFNTAESFFIVCKIIKSIGTVALSVFIGVSLFAKDDEHSILQTMCASIIDVAVIASLFLPQIFPAQINPIFWLCTVVTVLTFGSVILVFMDMKKSNVYLTANLHMEVERQIKDIRSVIAERDNLLQFVSHDMKKPLSSAVLLCDRAIERETNDEQLKTLSIIKQDAQRVIKNLTDIATFAKLNYIAEPSEVIDVYELCSLLYKYHNFDCDANGIILKNTVDTHVKVFVKLKGIENVASNIIINAIEHANCSTITLSVKTDKNKVVFAISDDGKGIDESLDLFKPYTSENSVENSGLGLYICKNIVESMNGELSFDSKHGGTTFFISLLKA